MRILSHFTSISVESANDYRHNTAFTLKSIFPITRKKTMKNLLVITILTLATLTTGCSTFIAKDYPVYLTKNAGKVDLTPLKTKATYSISDRTMQHQHSFRAASAGLANSWIVEFGKMFEASLQSDDYSSSFGANASKVSVAFDLENYEFKNFQTYLTMKVVVKKSNSEVLNKSYSVIGKNQTGKVMMTGAFGMKNAVQQSTKLAIDDLMQKVFADLKHKNIAIIGFQPTKQS